MTTSSPVFHLDSVTKLLGGRYVLNGVNLCVNQGECVVVVGPSGSGKSVLMRLLIGFLTPDEGQVRYFGGLPPFSPFRIQSNGSPTLGILFQNDALIEDLTIEENLALGARACGAAHDPSEIRIESRSLLERVGIQWEQKAHRKPSELSGGMRKRVALARALACQPDVLLVDEPTSGLDVQSSSQIARLLHEEIRGHQRTGVVITHDLFLARQLATRLFLVDPSRGKLEEVDIAAFVPEDFVDRMADTDPARGELTPEPRVPALKRFSATTHHILESIGMGTAAVAQAFPFPAPREFGRRLREAILSSLPLVGAIFLLIGMILYVQTRSALAPMGMFNLLPDALAEATLKLVPPFLGLVMAGRLGSVICAEAGLLRQTGQLDAMRVLGLSPERYLLSPSLWAAVVAMPLLVLISEAAALAGALLMLLVPGQGTRLTALKLANEVLAEAEMPLFALGLLKSVLFGIVIVLCGYFFGTREQSGSTALGRSITGAIVVSFLAIIALDFLASLVTLGV